MTPKQEAEWMKYLYGSMSDEQLARLHTSAETGRKATALAANDGDHRFDHLAASFERIIIDTETIQRQRQTKKEAEPIMSRRTYYTVAITGTMVAFILDCLAGGPLFSNPVATIYMIFALLWAITYHVVKPRRKGQP